MSVSEFIDDIYGAVETEGLSDSDRVYLQFRQSMEPGMLNAKFDSTPAKSSAFRNRHTGERLTDQTLRSHILNGAAFGARLNHALRKLDPDTALTDDELREALALYACHDLHKTIPAQIRRDENRNLADADKEIPEEEVNAYVEVLRLSDLNVELTVEDYYASALAAEERSGRHREVPSRAFERYRDWIRVMDAAASLDALEANTRLEKRINKISGSVELTSHRVDDTKGLVTNLLHTTIVNETVEIEEIVPLVFFSNGTLYLTTDADCLIRQFSGGLRRAEELTDTFITELRESRQEFQNPKQMTGSLNEDWQKCRIGIPTSLALLVGFSTATRSVKHFIGERSENLDFSDYNVYEDAVIVGSSGGLFDGEVPSAAKGVAVGLQLSTFYEEMYKPLSDGDRRVAITHLTRALGIPEVGAFISENTEGWRLKYQSENPSTETVAQISSHLDIPEDEISESLTDGVSLESGGTLSSPVLFGMAFLSRGTAEETQIREFPLERILEIIEERLLGYYHDWPEEWDSLAPIEVDSNDTVEEKIQQFERSKEGLIWSSFPIYLGQQLRINGRQVLQVEVTKSKLDEYVSSGQPHICLESGDLLLGSGRLEDFNSDLTYVGFTHYKPLSPSRGEPTSVVSPQYDLELMLRSTVYESPEAAHYVLLAPDYFHSPGDLAFADAIHSRLFLGGERDLRELYESLVTGDQINRWNQINNTFETILSDEEEIREIEFQNLVQNYNRAYEEDGALGIYQLQPPLQDDNEPITRIPRWTVSAFATMALSFLTSSRAFLSDNPLPATEFEDFPEMARFNQLPGPVQGYTGDAATISLRRHLETESDEVELRSRLAGQSRQPVTDDARSLGLAEVLDAETTAESNDTKEGNATETTRPVQIVLSFQTEFEVKLQTVASLLAVTTHQYGNELQRVKTVMDRAKQPFPGAQTILKGDNTIASPEALHAALVFDTLQYPTMSNRIDKLADAGFQTLHPDTNKDTNYEYERLFRVARDAISDGAAQNLSRDEMIDIVAGAVMKAASRADDSRYGEESVKREAAEEFSERFINDIYFGICDGEFYELRRQENELASGYNAAIRRRQQRFFDEHNDT